MSVRKGVVEALAGPSASTVKDAVKVGNDLISGDVDRKTIKSIRNLAPMANAFYLRRILTDPAESYIADDLLGLPQ